MGEQLLHETTSLCKVCKNALPARVVARDASSGPDGGAEVWMCKACPQHGAQEVRLSNNAAWYQATRATDQLRTAPRVVRKEVERGCPFDCGPCGSHTQKVRLPVVTITSACNLDCPICYVHNKNDDAFHMGRHDFGRILDHLREDHHGELDIINLTGGEPTLHPHLFEFLEQARAAGVHRVTVCSNGVKLVRDEGFVRRLSELGARVALSFDSLNHETDVALQSAALLDLKLRCLDILEQHDVDTTLIPVMTRGVNDHEIGKIIEVGMKKKNVRHLEVHTMTFTGQSGASFDRSGRISMYEVLQRIEDTTGGLLRTDDFVPSPCAHPLCYAIVYLLIDPDGGPPIPFPRFMPKAEVYRALSDRLYLEPTPALEESLRAAIDRLWSEGGDDSERTLKLLRRLLLEMFPGGRSVSRRDALRAGERAIKAIYVHSHMDEETFDTERAADCCDSNCYPDGTTIPVCNYNVLYREKEAAFNLQPKVWNERSGGQRSSHPRALPVVR